MSIRYSSNHVRALIGVFSAVHREQDEGDRASAVRFMIREVSSSNYAN